jgi:hypothetical protein
MVWPQAPMMICCWHMLMLPMIDVLVFWSSNSLGMTCYIVFVAPADDLTDQTQSLLWPTHNGIVSLYLAGCLDSRSSECHTLMGTLCEVSFGVLANHFTGSVQSLSLSTSQCLYTALSRRVSSWAPGRVTAYGCAL